MKRLLLFLLLGMFLFSLVSAESIGTVKQGDEIQLTNYCWAGGCTSATLTSITYPNGKVENINSTMTKNTQNFNYTYTPTEIGVYSFNTCSNPWGILVCDSDTFEVTSTGTGGSMFFIILITILALIFFISSLFVPEEFFVYISGVSFLIGGIYLMINGIDVLNDTNTRYLSYLYIGIGFLFSIGAYVYNLYSENSEEEY